MICSLYDISTERYQDAKNYVIHKTDILFLSFSLCNDLLTVYARSESMYLATSYEK